MKKKKVLSQTMLIALAFIGAFALIAVFNFQLFLILINILWLTIFSITVIFIVLGVLTFTGRKKEASQIVDLFLEGSITMIDVGNFVKDIFNTFMEMLIEFLLVFVPYLSFALAFLLYLVIIFVYKLVGLSHDVTLMSLCLSFGVTFIAGLITLPKKPKYKKVNVKLQEIGQSFKSKFIDAFEVVIFVLFLTIDAENLFFLPVELHVPVKATIANYDLMVRGIHITDHFIITVQIIVLGVALELLRQIIRVSTVAYNFYMNPEKISDEKDYRKVGRSTLVKAVLRKTVDLSKDDFLMFAAFTVFITFVFLIFPRLKLLVLISASLAGLSLDIIFTQRLAMGEKEDLLSRLFQRLMGKLSRE